MKFAYFHRSPPNSSVAPSTQLARPGDCSSGGGDGGDGTREPGPGRRCQAAGEALRAHAQAAPRGPRPGWATAPSPRVTPDPTTRLSPARSPAPTHPPEHPARSAHHHHRSRPRSYLWAVTWRRRARGARRSPAQRGGRRGRAARRGDVPIGSAPSTRAAGLVSGGRGGVVTASQGRALRFSVTDVRVKWSGRAGERRCRATGASPLSPPPA